MTIEPQNRNFQITLVFTKELNFFLGKKPKKTEIPFRLRTKRSIKDIIESAGVPHTEVGKIVVNRKEKDFGYIPESPVTINILSIKPPFDVTQPSMLRTSPIDEVRFIVDVNVGKLSKLLRIVGIDTLYSNAYSDSEVAELAETEKRIVLTKDTALLKRNKVVFGRYVRSVFPLDQLQEVIRFFGLNDPFHLFTRCLQCNMMLHRVEKQEVIHLLLPKTKKYYHRFYSCPKCRKVYWKGTHHDHIEKKLKSMGINIAET